MRSTAPKNTGSEAIANRQGADQPIWSSLPHCMGSCSAGGRRLSAIHAIGAITTMAAMSVRSAAAAEPDHNVDLCNFGAIGRVGQLKDFKLVRRGIGQMTLVFPVEMWVIVGARVEIAF